MVHEKRIVQTRNFTKDVENLIKKRHLLQADFETLKRELAQNPKVGDVISGTGGIRKTRLKSSSRGKSGGFRICYLDIEEKEVLYLILIYAKNEKENINKKEKKVLKELVAILKGTNK